jgi:hypothetical protein
MQLLGGILAVAGLGLIGCSTTEYANAKKPKSEYAADYDMCQKSTYNDPKNQQGSKLMVLRAVDSCMAKEGWYIVETP